MGVCVPRGSAPPAPILGRIRSYWPCTIGSPGSTKLPPFVYNWQVFPVCKNQDRGAPDRPRRFQSCTAIMATFIALVLIWFEVKFWKHAPQISMFSVHDHPMHHHNLDVLVERLCHFILIWGFTMVIKFILLKLSFPQELDHGDSREWT